MIDTKTYGESYWTKMEQDYLNENGIPKFFIDAKDIKETNDEQCEFAKSPKKVIREFINQMATQ